MFERTLHCLVFQAVCLFEYSFQPGRGYYPLVFCKRTGRVCVVMHWLSKYCGDLKRFGFQARHIDFCPSYNRSTAQMVAQNSCIYLYRSQSQPGVSVGLVVWRVIPLLCPGLPLLMLW